MTIRSSDLIQMNRKEQIDCMDQMDRMDWTEQLDQIDQMFLDIVNICSNSASSNLWSLFLSIWEWDVLISGA